MANEFVFKKSLCQSIKEIQYLKITTQMFLGIQFTYKDMLSSMNFRHSINLITLQNI
jgi:hypothetical protein